MTEEELTAKALELEKLRQQLREAESRPPRDTPRPQAKPAAAEPEDWSQRESREHELREQKRKKQDAEFEEAKREEIAAADAVHEERMARIRNRRDAYRQELADIRAPTPDDAPAARNVYTQQDYPTGQPAPSPVLQPTPGFTPAPTDPYAYTAFGGAAYFQAAPSIPASTYSTPRMDPRFAAVDPLDTSQLRPYQCQYCVQTWETTREVTNASVFCEGCGSLLIPLMGGTR